jgi:hypothetical protein
MIEMNEKVAHFYDWNDMKSDTKQNKRYPTWLPVVANMN